MIFNYLIKRKIKVFVARFLFPKYVVFEKGAYISIGSKIFGTPIHIDKNTGIDELYVVGSQPVKIGKYCAIGGKLTIITSNHKMNKPNIQGLLQNSFDDPIDDGSKGPVIIGNNVWIGLNVTILPGVRIGDGAVIGAGSVVTKNVEPFTINAGNPARFVRKRFSDKIINRFMKDPWWEWSDEKIKANKHFFCSPY